MKNTAPRPKLRIFYDGECRVCSHEIRIYRRADAEGALEPIDIRGPGFDARAYRLDPLAVRRYLHVAEGDGDIQTGLGAFIAIWERLPQKRYHALARIARLPLLQGPLKAGYFVFARAVRPLLPKVRHRCNDGSCST